MRRVVVSVTVMFLLVCLSSVCASWTLTCTIPRHRAVSSSDCSAGAETLTTFSRLRVWRQRQSPIAVRLGAKLYTDRDSFAAYWPQVRRDADPQWVMNAATVPIVLPDTLSLGWWYFVTVVDQGGRESCQSNNVWR